jgi:hypothetical protein
MDRLACNELHNLILTTSLPSFFKQVKKIKANAQRAIITTTVV